MSKHFQIFLSVLILFIVSLFTWGSFSSYHTNSMARSDASGSQNVCGNFLGCISVGNFTSAYSLLSPQGKKLTSPQKLKASWSNIEKEYGKLKKWNTSEAYLYATTDLRAQRGEPVEITYCLYTTKDDSDLGAKAYFTCEKVNGKWYIRLFRF